MPATALRFMEWNMEWLNDLVVAGDGPAAFRPPREHPEHAPSGVTVQQRLDDLRGVLQAIEPDVLVVVEGPSRAAELALFFQQLGFGTWKTHLQQTRGSSQNVGVAVRTDRGLFQADPISPTDTTAVKAFDDFTLEAGDTGVRELYRFERRPLLAEIRLANGRSFDILGLHLKSKGIFGALEWSRWWELADGNRKKILAQARQVHDAFIDPFLRAPTTHSQPIIACGDINAGPRMDASEKRLNASGVERLTGDVWRPETILRNALFDSLTPRQQAGHDFDDIYTTRFRDPIFNNITQREWIDHLLYSNNVPGPTPWVRDAKVLNRIGTEWFDAKYPHSSDHFPVIAAVQL